MNFKVMFFIALGIIVITNLLWLYIFIDQSVTYDYTLQTTKGLRKDINLMRTLVIDFDGTNDKERIIEILKKKHSDLLKIEEDGTLFVENIGLRFENNKLAEIVFMNDL